jgi:site-specific recombinase XerD
MLATIPQTESNSLLSQNPAVVYISSLAPGSRRTMRQSLNAIASMLADGTDLTTFPWHQLRYAHTTAIRSLLAEKYSAATANKMLCALKRVLVECKRLGLMGVEDCDRATDLKRIKENSPLKGRALTREEISSLVNVCINDSSLNGLRDLAILSVLRVGLRRSEVVGLDLGDINFTDGSILVRHGKGNKTRVVYLTAVGVDHLRSWIENLGSSTPLFIALSKSGKPLDRRLSNQTILTILNKRAKQAGIEVDFSCHDFRRTFISELLDGGVDITTVQKMAGHSSIETTSRYDRRGNATMKKAVSILDL